MRSRKSGKGEAPRFFRAWFVLLTDAYADDLIAAVARAGFVVEVDDPPCLGSGPSFVLSLRIEIGDRISVNRAVKIAIQADGDPPSIAPHQCEELRRRLAEIVQRRRMKIHALIVAAEGEAAWCAGTIDLDADIETYRRTFS